MFYGWLCLEFKIASLRLEAYTLGSYPVVTLHWSSKLCRMRPVLSVQDSLLELMERAFGLSFLHTANSILDI